MTPEQLQRELETKIADLDVRRLQAQADVDACTAQIEALSQRSSDVQVASTTLASLPPVGPLLEWRDHLPVWRENFVTRLLAVAPDDHDRATQELQQGLRLSIANIDRGCGFWPNGAPMIGIPLAEAIAAAGYEPPANRPGVAWYGNLQEVEHRIKQWTKQRDEAQAALDNALLDDDERAKQDAEREQYGQTYESLRFKIGTDGHLVPHRVNGSELPESEMTPDQKKVLERANAA